MAFACTKKIRVFHLSTSSEQSLILIQPDKKVIFLINYNYL